MADAVASAERLRFDQLMRDVRVDEQARLRKVATLAAAKRRYVVLFSPRSGSSWLTNVLASTERLGFPEEYINPDFVVGVARHLNAATAPDLLDALVRQRKSANNVFGIEARAMDVELFGVEAFAAAFGGETLYFHLWRENLVAQAVSLLRAVQTAQFHSSDAAAASPGYDAPALSWWVVHVADMENANVRLLRQLGMPARSLRYEELIGDRARAVALFGRALAVPVDSGGGEQDLRKLGDAWNIQVETRFRTEQPAFVQRIEAARLVRTGFGDSPHAPPPDEASAREAWQRGRASGEAGESPLNNPFGIGSAVARCWRAGWARGWDEQVYRQV